MLPSHGTITKSRKVSRSRRRDMGRNAFKTSNKASTMSARNFDPRFALYHRQPRADKLDARQRAICAVDHAYADALKARVKHEGRFSAYMAHATLYIDLDAPCPKCGGFRKRTRDRSCYQCHIKRGGENFERMKAGIAPIKRRSLAGHLDMLAAKKAERQGEHLVRVFGALTAKRWPTGRLEVVFPNGAHEPDVSKMHPHYRQHAMDNVSEFVEALIWAGWL